MPVNAKAVIDVEVDDKQFKAFTASFEKYVRLLGQTPKAWAQMSAEQKAITESFTRGTAALMAQGEIMRKNAAHAKDVSIHSESSFKNWKDIANKGKEFGSYVLGITGSMMKWAGIAGGIITGGGVAGMFGLDRLAQWVRGGSIAGNRVNMGAHELRAVKTSIGDPYGIDVEGIAKMVATAQGNPASNEYRMIKSFAGRDPESLKGTGKVTEVLLGLIERMERGDNPARIAAMTGGLFNEGDLNSAWANRTAIREASAKAPAEAERVKVDPATTRAWNDFLTQLESAAEQLKKILVVGLQPILGMITEHSQEWLDALREFMKKDGAFQEFLKEVPPIVHDVGEALKAAFHVAKDLLTWLGYMNKKPDKVAANAAGMSLHEYHRKEGEAQAEANAEARRQARRETGDAIIQKFGELLDYFRTGKQPGEPQKGYQDGTPMVPRTGTYTLHRGEMVLPEADADLLRHSTMADWKRAITGIESGGNYGIVNPRSGATGKYQVMPGNIGPWTREALGYSMSQDQFRHSAQAQERVFEHVFAQYVARYGNPIDAAAAWFSGQPFAGNRAGPDAMGTTVPGYIKQFLAGLGASSSGRMSVDINDNTGGNVSLALSQMSIVALPLHPI